MVVRKLLIIGPLYENSLASPLLPSVSAKTSKATWYELRLDTNMVEYNSYVLTLFKPCTLQELQHVIYAVRFFSSIVSIPLLWICFHQVQEQTQIHSIMKDIWRTENLHCIMHIITLMHFEEIKQPHSWILTTLVKKDNSGVHASRAKTLYWQTYLVTSLFPHVFLTN